VSRRTALLLLAGAVLACWLPSLDASFQFDDYGVIVNDARVQSLGAWLQSMPAIRPLLRLSYALNNALGNGPAGFRIVNVLVHATNTCLVLLLLESLGLRCGLEAAPAWRAALVAALLFALHPVQTEAVTYLSGRSSSLSAMFVLGSLLAWSRGFEGDQQRLRRGLGYGLGLLALATKESAIVLPLAMILWAAMPVADDAGADLRHRQLRSAFACAALLAAAGLVLLALTPYAAMVRHALLRRDPWQSLLAESRALPWLLGQLLMPWQLNADPDLRPVESASAGMLLVLVATLLAIVAAALNLRRRPAAAFAVLWPAVWLLPVNLLFPREDLANDRQLYLALAGPAWLVGNWFASQSVLPWAGGTRADRAATQPANARAGGVTAAFALLLVALGALTVARNRIYANEVRFWWTTAQSSPLKARPWNNLGFAYARICRDEDARTAFEQAAELDPVDLRPRVNLKLLALGRLAPEERRRCAENPASH
jgi:tetratricopeptide (TPR) repeat protein